MDKEKKPRDTTLLEVGSTCTVPTCSKLDFLATKCQYCEQMFCAEHLKTWSHSCKHENENESKNKLQQVKEDSQTFPSSSSSLSSLSAKTVVQDVRNKHMNAIQAEKEQQEQQQSELKQKQKAALQEVRKVLGSSSSSSSSSSNKKPKQISPIVQTQILRRNAKSLNPATSPFSIPAQKRACFYLAFIDDTNNLSTWPPSEDLSKQDFYKPVWLDPETSLGKTLDLAADYFKVKNNNNQTKDPSKLLYLYIPKSSDNTKDRLFGANLNESHVEPLSQSISNVLTQSKSLTLYLIRGDTKFRQ